MNMVRSVGFLFRIRSVPGFAVEIAVVLVRQFFFMTSFATHSLARAMRRRDSFIAPIFTL